MPPEVEREGLAAFELIGEDVREVLERRSASQVVVQLIYQKFIRKDRKRNAEGMFGRGKRRVAAYGVAAQEMGESVTALEVAHRRR